jgi:hypothetical protein
MGKQPLEGVDLDQFARMALDEARLHADDNDRLSQNWSQIALAAAILQLARTQQDKQN